MIDGLNQGLADYLNQPVRGILATLGLSAPASPPEAPPDSGSGGGIDPTQMIKPVTDALGTLGSGQFGDEDPTQMLDGITSAFEDTAEGLTQALSDVGGAWQGDAATAAMAATRTAMTEGSEVGTQAQNLRTGLLAATMAVQQARARLMEIVGEFWATIAAIGPNIVFPWGMAAAIEAAMKAVTEATEIMVETQGTMAGAAAKVTTDGAPVSIAQAAQSGGGTGSPGGSLLSSVPGLASPALQSVNALSGTPSGPGIASEPAPAGAPAADHISPSPLGVTSSHAPVGGGTGSGGGAVIRPSVTRLATPPVSASDPVADEPVRSVVSPGTTSAGAPMAGGAPLGHHAGAGADGKHTAASYLHTANQGEQIVGRASSAAAPPVVGETVPSATPDIELRI